MSDGTKTEFAKREECHGAEIPKREFHRTRKITIEELFEGYEGECEPPPDWPRAGKEIDWGEPVGKEMV